MKSRSHRMPTINNEPPDDWGDGSWTVDCVCGVNFDDGEEMVNCDECGVWVHTRCSRYIKGETSFACDKCKGRKTSRANNVNEEEVAQLLVELPTKTMNMDSNYNSNNVYPPPAAATKASSLRLWTEIPMEERVHVHGVPGGDPGLFKGISSVFTSELWKCSGYVPKKFNFKYREFPCWEDDKESVKKFDEESENPVDNGADALFSLSKEIVSGSPVEMLVGLRGSVEKASREKRLASKEGKKRDRSYSSVGYGHDGLRKESIDVRPSGIHPGKRKKDSGRTKELIAKKKARTLISKDASGKRRVSTTGIGAQVESLKVKVRESKVVGADHRNSISGDKTTLDSVTDGSHHRPKNILTLSVNHAEDSVKKAKPKDSLAVDADHTEGSFKKSKHRDNVAISAEESLKKAKPRDNVAASAEESLKKAKPRDNVAASVEDPLKKAKPKIIAEISAHHTDDMLRKVRVKDKSLTKSHHGEDLTKKVKVKDNLTAYSYHGEDRSKDSWRNSTLVEIVVKSESDHQDPTRTGSSSETVAVEVSLLDPNGISPIKKYKDRNVSVDGLGCLNDEKHTSQDLNGNISDAAFSSARSSPRVRDTSNIATEVQEGQVHQDAHESMLASTSRSVMKEKTEAKEVHTKGSLSSQTSSLVDVKLDGGKHVHQHLKISVSEQPCEDLLVHETHSSSSPSVELAVTESKPLSCCEKTNTDEGMIPVSGEPCENTDVGSVGTLSLQESASKSKLLKNVEEPLKTGAINLRPSSPVSQRKVVPDFGRSSLSSTVLVSKSEVSGSCKPPGRPASPSTLRPVHFSKRVKPNSHSDIKKDHAATDTVKDDLGHEEPRNMAGEQFKSSVAGALKSSHLSRGSHGSTSERNSSDVNDSVLHPSAKASVAQNVTLSTVLIESVSKAQSDCTPQVQNKTTASGLSEKGERFNSSGSHPSSKATHSSSMHPPPPVNSSTLSDEELALLLHQELNSSPRVPRVPRMRQASGNPQSTPPTATSMLIKRASSSGAKDHILFSRRKGKEEVPKDASRNSREPIDENKKMNGVLSSHDHQTQDQGITSDVSTKKEAPSGSPEMRYTAKRNSPLSSTSFGQSSSFETIDQNLSSLHKSPRANSDDDYNDNAAGIAGPATRTLPGLLDEIMSKGRRMTYEELCNAVLPHWNNLRKHNGERYAYSSHSQAVLDCLRNRNEWAQLVDRGPKTTAGRKKRKIEPEAHTAEQEENGYGKSRATRELATKAFEAHPEDFPKGKRKARKRRRLALQGRGIKDIRKRQKSNVVTDEEDDEDEDNDAGPFSPSSDGGIFSEDSQGAKSRPTASEASSSFEDAGSL